MAATRQYIIFGGMGPGAGHAFLPTRGYWTRGGVSPNPIVVISGPGDHVVVPTPPLGRFIRIHAWLMTSDIATHIQWSSGTTPISGVLPIGADGILQQDYAQEGLFDCLPHQALNINVADDATVQGLVVYSTPGL